MIKSRFAKLILKYTPSKLKAIYEFNIKNKYEDKLEYAQLSYAQEGEDVLLSRIFDGKPLGFFVDVGAHHPRRFSNTFIFYKRGWRGINIDPIPTMTDLFNRERPHDINLQMGVGDQKTEMIYYIFNEPALNTFSEIEAQKKHNLRDYKIIEKKTVKIDTLENILDLHMPKNTQLDFLSVDAEGLDLTVLKSNNFDKYKPRVILVEMLESKSLQHLFNTELYQFLESKDYNFFAKTFNTAFFILK